MKARIQKLMGQAFFQQGDFEKSLSHFVKVSDLCLTILHYMSFKFCKKGQELIQFNLYCLLLCTV